MGSFRRPIFPRVMRETSRRSSISRARCFTCRWTTSFAQSSSSSVSSLPKSWTALLMAESGFRSSWASIARNSSFLRSASSRSASMSFSWVMSRPIFEAPMISALGVADGRDGERDVDDRAVLPPPLRLVVVHLLAAADPAENLRHVLDQLGRHEHRDVLADDLLGRVAEDSLGPLVPARDDAVEVLRDDDVVGRLDDGREPLVQQLGPPLLGDVAEDQDDAARRGPRRR